MNRERLLPLSAIVLVAGYVLYHIWSGWGLITVHADGKPLSEIIHSIEKQAGIVMKTNMDVTTTVAMHVDKVPLSEALETLGAITDSRCRLTYVLSADKASALTALDAMNTPNPLEGWKRFDVPLMGQNARGEMVSFTDPRDDVWNVKAPSEQTLQGYLLAASTSVSAAFLCPESYNPPLSKGPPSGPIEKSISTLAKAANAHLSEVFMLTGRPPGMPPGDEEEFERPRGAGRPNPLQIRERRLAEIEKMPPSQREPAMRELEEMQQLFIGMATMSEEERRAKREELFNRPDIQDRVLEARMAREERQTPDQRQKRYQKYVERKRAAKEDGK
jgi:hypothetical protein